MDFSFSEAEEELRQRVRRFLAEEGFAGDAPHPIPPSYMPGGEFERKAGATGWLALSWPVEYGGGGRSAMEQAVVDEELAYCGYPGAASIGRAIVAPAIMAFGSEEQKREFVPRLARGEISFCLGYSEPESGSDLVSLRTRAVLDGDEYVINGRKVWTSGADKSNYCWLLAQTDTEAPKHRGLSLFIVPMDSPGVEVRPLTNLLEVDWFTEVTFDDVRVPRTALVGQENRGWYQVASALEIERLALYPAREHYRVFEALVRHARQTRRGGRRLGDDTRVRQRLAQLAIDFEVARLLSYRVVWMRGRGDELTYEASMLKLFNTELTQRLYSVAMEIVGAYGGLLPDSRRAPLSGVVGFGYLDAVQGTIGAGTSEIQRDVIAGRGLGLPRG
jgi:alkylation response protein AidB-like acyl-CoA dehydrogenase